MWRRLVEAAGDKPLFRLNLTSKHLIKDFLVLQEKLGRRPKLIEYTCQCHTPKVLDRVFGKPGFAICERPLSRQAGGETVVQNDRGIVMLIERDAGSQWCIRHERGEGQGRA
jgi:hypothetical protein